MFNKVEEFEKEIAKFYGAPYAVATDCCTHAIELSLRYLDTRFVFIPKHTYISIPFTAEKLGIYWQWNERPWQDYYYLNSKIIDAAVYWRRNGYVPSSFMCLSFQFKKHLSLGRGGAILCENLEDYVELKKMSYDGRLPDIPWANQDIKSIGYHYYMTPETAQQGIDRLPSAIASPSKQWSWQDYPDLSTNSIFKIGNKCHLKTSGANLKKL
jgi:hypothetical protein